MIEQGHASTKETIIRAAAKLFSVSGYNKVTIREIAQAAGINSALIYYYFSSKSDILSSLYKFYSEERRKMSPDLNELLRMAETSPSHEVLMKSGFQHKKEAREILDQILVIAAREISSDSESERFIKENICDPIIDKMKPLLKRLMELGKIKPIDIDTFIGVLSYYCFSAAALNNSAFRNSPEKYLADLSFIFSSITNMEFS
jgi:AcrR family transcriptional regulator